MAPPPPPRTLLRTRAIRADIPQAPAADRDEEKLLRGRYYEAGCLATDAVGHFVQITGPKVAGYRQVSKVDIEDSTTMPAIGVIIEKSNITSCFVQAWGELEYSGLVEGTRYWVGADSKLADMPPSRVSGKIVVAQIVGVALEDEILLLRPSLNPVKLRG